MTLGQRIAQYRKDLGISQEELGARLGVSRQAVSKWETGAATPGMANLIALAKELGVPLPELADIPETATVPPGIPREKPAKIWPTVLFLCLLFAALAGIIVWGLWDAAVGQVDTKPTPPVPAPATDFALLWTNSDGHEEFLELGTQADFFPFGVSLELTAPEEVLDSDFQSLTGHRADCGALLVEYNHIETDPVPGPEGAAREVITALSTMVSGYVTPQGIGPGDSEADLLMAYGDELVYCLKEEYGYTLAPHDSYYAWSRFTDGGYCAILFYMERGQVQGVRMELLGELGNFYVPDNVRRFPMKNGEPDFSFREEPEQEEPTDTRRVYTAFNRLVTDNNLTAEERYACRRDIFSLLPDLDWGELAGMGGTEVPDDTVFALLEWLQNQETYTDSEILWIQIGCTAKGLDGAYTEAYCGLLSHIFFYDPAAFTKSLSSGSLPEDTKLLVIRFTAYGAELYEADLQAALSALDSALQTGQLTQEQSGWARLLRLYLTTPTEQRNDLPRTPEERPSA